jgi:hypothetical protein
MEDLLNSLTIPDELSPEVESKLSMELVFTDGVLPSKPLSLLERAICELYADSKTRTGIATYLGISVGQVKRILSKDYIKSFIQELVSTQYDMTKEYRISLLDKVIKAKIDAIENDLAGDYAQATKKDLVDLIMIQDSMLKEREKKELGTNEDTYITLLQQIVKK